MSLTKKKAMACYARHKSSPAWFSACLSTAGKRKKKRSSRRRR